MNWEWGSVLTAPPFGYSPELPLRRPGGPKTRPARSPAAMPAGIASSLRRLRGLHLRLSLCRITLTRGSDGRLGGIDNRSLIAELAEDGALIVIYIHPQGISDADAASGVAARLDPALRESGISLGSVRAAILPCDATAIDDNDTTLAMLSGLPDQPLMNLRTAPVAAAVS